MTAAEPRYTSEKTQNVTREKGRQLQASVWTKVFINRQTETIQTEKSHIFCLFTSIFKVTYLGKVVTFCHNCTVKLSYN